MTTYERLQEYYPFSKETLEQIAQVAEAQAEIEDYHQYLQAAGIERHEYDRNHSGYDGQPVNLVDFRPKEHDPDKALVVHLPMANPLDPNQLYQVATIAQANPDMRVLAAANPSGLGYGAGVIKSKPERQAVAHGNLRPVVDPLLRAMDQKGITEATHYGYSYGADKALAATLHGDQEVESVTLLEPAAVKERSLLKLGLDFSSTAKTLEDYAQAPGDLAFLEARKDSVGALTYNLGLARLSNIAVARYIAQGKFEAGLHQAMDAQPESLMTVAWGTESELAVHSLMQQIMERTQARRDGHRVRQMQLPGQKHAVANDIHLQAAVSLEGRKP